MTGQPVGMEALQQDFARDLEDGELVCVIDNHGIQFAVDPATGKRIPMLDPLTGGPLYAYKTDPATGNEFIVMERGPDGIPRPKVRHSSDGMCFACWLEQHDGWTECNLHGFQPPMEGVVGCAVCAGSAKQSALAAGLAAKTEEVRNIHEVSISWPSPSAERRQPDWPAAPRHPARSTAARPRRCADGCPAGRMDADTRAV